MNLFLWVPDLCSAQQFLRCPLAETSFRCKYHFRFEVTFVDLPGLQAKSRLPGT